MVEIRNVPTECLLNNIIDEDFQATLFPLNVLQIFFLIAKFDVINNFITPKNNISQYMASAIGIIILIFGFVFRFYYYYYAIEGLEGTFISFFVYFDVVCYSIITVGIHAVCLWHRGNTVELIIKLQNILNLIKIDKKPFLFKIRVQNWISILILIAIYAFYSSVPLGAFSFGLVYLMINIVTITPLLIFDLQIVIATRAIVLITKELEAWNNIMETYKKERITNEEVKYIGPSENDMFIAYADIVAAFDLCNKVYTFPITFIAFETFAHILVNLQFVIEFGKSNITEEFFRSTAMKLLTSGWNLKNFTLVALLSIASENFYGTIKTADATCAQILSSDQTIDVRRTCKNVCRLRRAALRKLSACGVFELDATLPVRLLTALLAYTVVLLQFEFL